MKSCYLKSLSVLAVLLLTACGGGGGGSSSTELVTLDTETINKLGSNMATATPGCDYTSETVATATYLPGAVESYRSLIDTMKKRQPLAARNASKVSNYATSEVGNCGGTFVITGEHDNGDDDLTVTYTNFCNSTVSGAQTVTNGVASLFYDGHATDDGPVLDRILVSTGVDGVSVVSTVDGETSTDTVYIDGFELSEGETSGTTIKANKISVDDDGHEFKVTEMSISITDDSESSVLQIDSLVYHDPDSGAVKISTSALPLDAASSGSATITITGADGTSATFTADDLSVGLFTARDTDGNVIGALDCTGLASGI